VAARYAFEDFTLDTSGGELKRGGKSIHLSPKAFQLLVYLVEHAGTLIEKPALLDAVWPETHVSEGSLNRAVATLRAALGDDAAKPSLIETVPWRGYRFIAPMNQVDRFAPRPIVVYHDVEYPLKMGENLIGREGDCDVTIRHGSVSRHHARIRVTSSGVTIMDVGSRNGTFVRGVRIGAETALQHNDEIRVGSEVLRFLLTAGSTITLDIPLPS
jgi:DNA-binding winged helix-turn-helix (wHTH) protein